MRESKFNTVSSLEVGIEFIYLPKTKQHMQHLLINSIEIPHIILFIMLLVFFYLLLTIPVGLWYLANVSGIKITIFDMLLMQWRKIPAKDILYFLIKAKREEIALSLDEAQMYFLAGLDLEALLDELLQVKNNGFDAPVELAASAQLDGIDLTEAIRKYNKQEN
jgi:uncharacterized protein YqfA (UPF0365 family)